MKTDVNKKLISHITIPQWAQAEMGEENELCKQDR